MDIGYLADHPRFLPTIARWHHAEWGYLRPGDSIDARMLRLQKSCGRGEIPTTVIAFAADHLLGTAMLVDHDMDVRMDLSPWLASVFVANEHRGKGIGTALVGRIVEEATRLGARSLYLYTPGAERFYERMGWSVVDRMVYRETQVVVMCHDLAP